MKNTGTKVMGWVAVVVLAMSAGSAFAGKPVIKKEVSGVVNLNTASAQQLDLLPGIGEKAAKRIIEHRSKTPFGKVEDLRKVKGFGAKKLEKLKSFLTTSGPTTVAVKKVKTDAKADASPAPAAQGRRPQNR
ncbi:MAG: helix-hairpin-helix domain-containing protein [Archangium sp.]|nr:helix-hairpin-helix domain-containing protein [Archangium sp.]MDP3569486.1 helix-hairpin-helix domain-containing protein [Archangium sp.]